MARPDDPRLLVGGTVEGDGIVPLPWLQLIGNLHGVIGCLTDEGVVGHKEHSLLDVRGLVPEDIVEQLDSVWISDVPQSFLERCGFDVVQWKERLRLQHLVLQILDALPGCGLAGLVTNSILFC